MIRRCYAPNCSDFANYGKRGITVCKRWRNSFPNFLADMGQRPSRRHTLERKNNSLGYMLNNCIWADDIAQNNNTRRNRKLTVGDRTLSISQWAREYGMPPTTLRQRIVAYGWDFERAVSTPIDARKANRRKR